MPFFAPNPNVGTGGAPVATPPMPGQYPGGNWLLEMWRQAQQQTPWAVPQGLQPIPHQFPQVPGGGILTQPIADIYKFPPKVPGMLGATEGAGGRGLGSRGGGMLGSKWRDPGYVQQYEVQQGLKPGSLQPPSAPVTPIAPPGGRQMDFGKYNAKVTDPRMLTPEARLLEKLAAEKPVATVKLPPREGPTPAQMARPVKQTPEISAKLAAARAERAKRSKVSPLLNKEDREAMRVEAADKAARRTKGPLTPRELHEKFNPSAKDSAQTSFGGTMSRPEFSLRDYAKAIERGPEAAKAYRNLHLPQSSSKSTEVWGPSTPGWNQLSKEAKNFLRGKPVKGPPR